MIIGSVDRIEEGILVILTHTEPVHTINLPKTLFPDFKEGDIIEISVEKSEESAQNLRGQIEKIRKGLNRVEL